MKLINKIALVTGGTSGIGLATARLFRAEGAHVIVTGIDARRLEEASRHLGPDAMVLRADLRRPAALDPVIAAIAKRYGRLDSCSRMRAPAQHRRSTPSPKNRSTISSR
jgi:NAD(P)-dependent dehydrogenase (short-subunit alcohol dehydrogenase family)